MIWAYLRLLAGQPGLRQRLGENARQYVTQRHDAAVAVETYQRFLGEILEQVKRREIALPRQTAAPDEAVPGVDFSWEERAEDVDIELLMEKVRQGIGETYLSDRPPLPVFAGYRPSPYASDPGDKELMASMEQANRTWDLPAFPPDIESIVDSWDPKQLTTLLTYLARVIQQQADFNTSVIRVLNRLFPMLYDADQDSELASLRYQVEALYKRLSELEHESPR
jgi:hypothetical protein